MDSSVGQTTIDIHTKSKRNPKILLTSWTKREIMDYITQHELTYEHTTHPSATPPIQ